jgi:large subunit ribosomal protein L28
MPKVCAACGKGQMIGRKYKRRGMKKKQGGVGSKVTGRSLRRFLPNLQKVKVNLNGTIKRVLVYTSCIASGKITKA